jgi:hypothetical protein
MSPICPFCCSSRHVGAHAGCWDGAQLCSRCHCTHLPHPAAAATPLPPPVPAQIDFNLLGMGHLKLQRALFREPLPDTAPLLSPGWGDDALPAVQVSSGQWATQSSAHPCCGPLFLLLLGPEGRLMWGRVRLCLTPLPSCCAEVKEVAVKSLTWNPDAGQFLQARSKIRQFSHGPVCNNSGMRGLQVCQCTSGLYTTLYLS